MESSPSLLQYQDMCAGLLQVVGNHIRLYCDIERKFITAPLENIIKIYQSTYQWYFLENIHKDWDNEAIVLKIWSDRDLMTVLGLARQDFKEYIASNYKCKIEKPEFCGPCDKCSVIYTLIFDQKDFNDIPRLTEQELNDMIDDAKIRHIKHSDEIAKSLAISRISPPT